MPARFVMFMALLMGSSEAPFIYMNFIQTYGKSHGDGGFAEPPWGNNFEDVGSGGHFGECSRWRPHCQFEGQPGWCSIGSPGKLFVQKGRMDCMPLTDCLCWVEGPVPKSLCDQMHGSCDIKDAQQKCKDGKWMDMYNDKLYIYNSHKETLNIKYCRTSDNGCCAPSGQVFKADIENSISFALRNTILFKSNNGTRKLKTYGTQEADALRNFLEIMILYIEPGRHIQQNTYNFITQLKYELQLLQIIGPPDIIQPSDVIKSLNGIQTKGNPNNAFIYAEWQPAVSCHNIYQSEISKCYPHFWQYTCGLWNILHTLTVSALTVFTSFDPLQLLKVIHDYVVNFLGCDDCAGHFETMYNQTIGAQGDSSKVNSATDAMLWLWCAHNSVNLRFTTEGKEGNPEYEWPPHPPFPIDCPYCWATAGTNGYDNCANLFGFNNTNPGYDFYKPAVLTYLHNMYQGPYSDLNLKTSNPPKPLNLQEISPCPGPGP